MTMADLPAKKHSFFNLIINSDRCSDLSHFICESQSTARFLHGWGLTMQTISRFQLHIDIFVPGKFFHGQTYSIDINIVREIIKPATIAVILRFCCLNFAVIFTKISWKLFQDCLYKAYKTYSSTRNRKKSTFDLRDRMTERVKF